jgi:hypothetical protein
VLGGMKLSSSAAALRIFPVCREWAERVSRASKRGHGLTRLVDSVRLPKGLAAGFFSRTL